MLQRSSFVEYLSPFLAQGQSAGGAARRGGCVGSSQPCVAAVVLGSAERCVCAAWCSGETDAGKEAVLRDWLQFPSVPLMAGKLLGVPTP